LGEEFGWGELKKRQEESFTRGRPMGGLTAVKKVNLRVHLLSNSHLKQSSRGTRKFGWGGGKEETAKQKRWERGAGKFWVPRSEPNEKELY